MKKLLITLLFPVVAMAQQTDAMRTPVAAFTPLADDISHVSGLAVGFGHLWKQPLHRQVINGLNVDINPLGFFVSAFVDGYRIDTDSILLVQNGLHISSGGILGNAQVNGISASLYNVVHSSNGLTATLFQNYSGRQNGIQFSLFFNYSGNSNGLLTSIIYSDALKMKGLQLAAVTNAEKIYGLQAGLWNSAGTVTGLQIGLLNEAKKCRGLQIGLWNVNEKRSLPFINW